MQVRIAPLAAPCVRGHDRGVLHDPITDWLGAYPAPIAQLCQVARKRIIKAVPQAVEKLRPGWQLIGYNAPRYFAFVAPKADHVMLGFEWGVMLPNLDGLLEGSGTQVRFVTVRSEQVLRSQALLELLRSAAALVPPPRRSRC